MPARLIRDALACFAVAAALGAAVALAGPVPFVRLLGLVALLAALAGCVLQGYALRTFAPESYADLRARAAATASAVIAASRSAVRGFRARAVRAASGRALPA